MNVRFNFVGKFWRENFERKFWREFLEGYFRSHSYKIVGRQLHHSTFW